MMCPLRLQIVIMFYQEKGKFKSLSTHGSCIKNWQKK